MLSILVSVLRAKGRLADKISYLREYNEFHAQGKTSSFSFSVGRWFPLLREKTAASGTASGHYFHQDLLVARKIFLHGPRRHVDVGSRVDGFIAHVAAFREIEVFDIRPMPETIPNIYFVQADLINLPQKFISYADSLSCLHALEHFGLGRYGDPINYEGFVKGLENMQKIVASGGKFYLSVPVGPQRVEFNAHRVFAVGTILGLLEEGFRLDSFSYVDDEGKLFQDVPLDQKQIERNYGCRYGCGIFECTKR